MSIPTMSTFTSGERKEAAGDLTDWSEQKLVASAKCGKEPRLGNFVNALRKRSLQVAHRITRNREDAEDVLQDFFLSFCPSEEL
jgi:hypothetical protein